MHVYTRERVHEVLLIQWLTVTSQCKHCVSWDVTCWYATANKGGIGQEFLSHDWHYLTMYILGLSPSWGTTRICPAWSPSEHQLTLSLSPIGARVPSHAVRRRLFIFLMTAAHISPSVFPSETSSATYMYCLLRYTHIMHTYYTSHSYKQL